MTAATIAPALAVSPKCVGVFVGLIYIGGATASFASGGFIARYGTIRVSQVCMLLCAAGLLLLAVAADAATASMALLVLTFSVKQTGVPVGAALAGAVLPALALARGWRTALVAVVATGILITIVAQATRASYDADRSPSHPLSIAGLFAPLRILLAHRALAALAITGGIYAATQMCLMSFLVVYLTEGIGLSLVAAGLALTVANLGGIVGRIVWGAVADRFVLPRAMLGLLG